MPKSKNERQEQEIDLEQLPGDMKLALKYPGVNPNGKKKEEDYKAYINGVKTEIQNKLNGNAPRPEKIREPSIPARCCPTPTAEDPRTLSTTPAAKPGRREPTLERRLQI